MQRRTLIGAAAVVGVVGILGAVILVANLIRPDPPDVAKTTLARPAAGDVHADYLTDGTPIFVVGHRDGSVSVVSAFDTHVPFDLGKLNWWCPSADAFENPNHGSKWDAYGVKLGGPAPRGLPTWEVRVAGSQVLVGAMRPGAPIGAVPIGPSEADRDWCMPPDDEVLFHTFDGRRVWDSPSKALGDAGDEWILLEGELIAVPQERRVRLCALGNCHDGAVAANVEMPEGNIPFGPLGPGRFIAHVRDGMLVDVTRVVVLESAAP